MKTGPLRSSLYSPGGLGRDSLAATFVGREDLMENVLDRIAASVLGREKHHLLLVGPRGSGKSHFLALAGHRLDDWIDDNDARGRVAVARLREEEWGIASYLDFVVRILQALAEREDGCRIDVSGICRLFDRDPEAAEAAAVKLLRQCTRGRTLVLFCENLADVLRGLGRQGQQQWRAAIQEDGNWAIVASTPELSSALSRQDSPFYGFFAIRNLEMLDPDTGLELLIKMSSHAGREDVAHFLRTPVGQARARAIHHFSGGNHRAYSILFDFLDRQSLEDMVTPFMRLADELTPYYQGRMRVLPPAQRRIVEFLARAGCAMTVKDVAAACLMTQQTAAKQISALVASGHVVSQRLGRNTFCDMSEPLMRICMEIRGSRDGHCSLFVDFLRHWFSVRETDSRARIGSGIDRAHARPPRCLHPKRSDPLPAALPDEVAGHLQNGNYQAAAMSLESILQHDDSDDNRQLLVLAYVEAGQAGDAVSAGRQAAERYPHNADIHYWLARAHLLEGDLAPAHRAIQEAIGLAGGDSSYLCLNAEILLGLRRFEEAIDNARSLLGREPDHWYSLQQIIEALVSLNRIAEAGNCAGQLLRLVCQRHRLQQDSAPRSPDRPEHRALLDVAGFLLGQQLPGPALQLVDMVRPADPSARWHCLRGRILLEMRDYRGASRELRQCALRAPSPDAYCRLATALLWGGKWKEAIAAADRLIEIDSQHVQAHYVRAEALCKMGRGRQAIAAYDRLLPADDVDLLIAAAAAVRAMGGFAAAKRHLDRVAELQPDNRDLWIERIRLGIAAKEADDEVLAGAARLAGLPGGALLGRLFALQVNATDQAPEEALAAMADAGRTEMLAGDRIPCAETIAGILAASTRKCGPGRLAGWVAGLRKSLGELIDESLMVDVLRKLLHEGGRNGFAGGLDEWQEALADLERILEDMPACTISVALLRQSVRHAKTGDGRCLLRLPLEQRRLLKEILGERHENAQS